MSQSQHVLACIDGSEISTAICDYAAWISQRLNAPLKLLHTLEHQEKPASFDLTGSIGLGSQEHLLEELTTIEQQRSKLLKKKGQLILDTAKERVQQAGINDCGSLQRHGSITESLIDLEDETRVAVLGLRNEPEAKISTHLEMMVRAIHRPILLVNGIFEAPKTIMLAYDGSDAANKAVDMVATSPLYKGLNCHLVCVSDNAADLLQIASKKLEACTDINLTVSALTGKADIELCAYQETNNIDLTVMGAFSHTRLREMLLGSFTEKMLTHSKKPVLLLR
jgi:nucleotide-binding universal stress UspA family protein